MKKILKIFGYIIGAIALFFMCGYLYGEHIKANRFDDALERNIKGISIAEREMLILSFKEEYFLKTVRYGDIKGYYEYLKYSDFGGNPDVFSELKNLDLYCDSVFSNSSAQTIYESSTFRKKEKEAFIKMKSIVKEFCTMDLIHNSPEETERRIKELVEKWRKERRILNDRMISSHKRFYLLNAGRYE